MVISAVPTVGKNNQQIMAAMSKQVKQYHKLFDKYCGSARLEAVLLVHIQVSNLSARDCISCKYKDMIFMECSYASANEPNIGHPNPDSDLPIS